MHERQTRQRITNKNDTKNTFSNTSNQECNTFNLNRKSAPIHLIGGHKNERPIARPPALRTVQLIGSFSGHRTRHVAQDAADLATDCAHGGDGGNGD